MFLFGVKKTFALYHFLKPKNYILETNFCIFLYIQRRSKILFGGGWVGERLNDLFEVTGTLGLVKYFTFISLIVITWLSEICLMSLKALFWNFPLTIW